jgi:uncharacterized protein (DUF983 family)
MLEFLRACWDGLRLRCPHCHKGHIGKGLDIRTDCPVCGLRFQPDEGDWVGAIMVAYCVLAVVLTVLILTVAFTTDLTLRQHLYIWLPFSLAWLLGLYRNMKGIWIGILYVSRWSKLPHEPNP